MYLLKHKDDTVAVIEIFGSDASCIRVNDIVNHHLLPLCARHDISNKSTGGREGLRRFHGRV